MVKFSKSTSTLGWKVQLDYSIGVKDIKILCDINNFFGNIGTLRQNTRVTVYSVRYLDHIINFILPQFDKYSLVTQLII